MDLDKLTKKVEEDQEAREEVVPEVDEVEAEEDPGVEEGVIRELVLANRMIAFSRIQCVQVKCKWDKCSILLQSLSLNLNGSHIN